MGPTEYVLTPSPLGYKQSQPPTCCKKATLFLGSINHRAMKIHVGSEVIAPHIVNHDTRWSSGQLHTLVALPLGISHLYT